jgi:acyl dehydratase
VSLNKALVGREYPAVTVNVTAEAIEKYARACNDSNPAFFRTGHAGGIIAPPMFGVNVIWEALMAAVTDAALHANLLRLVHSEQDMEFLSPIQPGDTITSCAKILSIGAKATGETMTVAVESARGDGTLVMRTLFSVFSRGGGSRAPAAREPEPARGEPLFAVAQTVDQDQTYRYADASGDRNPIHVDANIARMAGLPGIIVHGLCTMAFTSKVVIDKLCGGDATRVKRLRVRFSRPVLPGQTITTKIWSGGGTDRCRIFVYETFNAEGQAVIKGGIAELAV